MTEREPEPTRHPCSLQADATATITPDGTIPAAGAEQAIGQALKGPAFARLWREVDDLPRFIANVATRLKPKL